IQMNGNLTVAAASTNSLALAGTIQMNGANRSIVNNLPSSATLTIGGNMLLFDATTPANARVLTFDGLGKTSITGNFIIGNGGSSSDQGTIVFGGNGSAQQGYIEISSGNGALFGTNDIRRTVLMLKNDE